MASQRVFIAYAHPDDESFGTGGTMARYAQQGIPITLVCATRGEVGGISDPSLATPETLGAVREAELQCAAQALGVTDLVFLGYRDSGMVGTPENDDPRAFVKVPADEVVPRLVRLMRTQRPTVVVTFDPQGGYGHPDHIAIHHHTVEAFHRAADASYAPDAGPPWRPARLFYGVITRTFFQQMKAALQAQGADANELTLFENNELGWPDDQVHVRLDVSDTVAAKWQALECHRTQFGDDALFKRMPPEQLNRFLSQETFALAWPDPEPGLQLDDLFSGL